MTTQPDLSKPSLAALSHVLRHPEIWPKGFKWNYDSCHRCGIGLTEVLWKVALMSSNVMAIPPNVGKALAIPDQQVVYAIFIDAHKKLGKPARSAVTPADVATIIDAYLSKQASERAARGVAKIIDTALHSPTSEPPPVYTVERVW